jgi:hypothetical protein
MKINDPNLQAYGAVQDVQLPAAIADPAEAEKLFAKTPDVSGKVEPSTRSRDHISETTFPLAGNTNKYTVHIANGEAVISAPKGTQVLAPVRSMVVDETNPSHNRDAKDGSTIMLMNVEDRTRWSITDMAQDSLTVKEGDIIDAGQVIGKVGEHDRIDVTHFPQQYAGMVINEIPIIANGQRADFVINDLEDTVLKSKRVADQNASAVYHDVVDESQYAGLDSVPTLSNDDGKTSVGEIFDLFKQFITHNQRVNAEDIPDLITLPTNTTGNYTGTSDPGQTQPPDTDTGNATPDQTHDKTTPPADDGNTKAGTDTKSDGKPDVEGQDDAPKAPDPNTPQAPEQEKPAEPQDNADDNTDGKSPNDQNNNQKDESNPNGPISPLPDGNKHDDGTDGFWTFHWPDQNGNGGLGGSKLGGAEGFINSDGGDYSEDASGDFVKPNVPGDTDESDTDSGTGTDTGNETSGDTGTDQNQNTDPGQTGESDGAPDENNGNSSPDQNTQPPAGTTDGQDKDTGKATQPPQSNGDKDGKDTTRKNPPHKVVPSPPKHSKPEKPADPPKQKHREPQNRLPKHEPHNNDGNLRAVWDMKYFIEEEGFTKQGAAAVIGNFGTESAGTYNPHIRQFGGGLGRGIGQWSAGARWEQLKDWAYKHGLDPESSEAQLGYTVVELKRDYPHLYNRLQTSHKTNALTREFMEVFERPGDPNLSSRKDYAHKALDTYKQLD